MRIRQINQGTVLYGIRSEKYPSTVCYGIIISARCDIAQGKVSKYYYLVAVDVDKWIQSRNGFSIVFKDMINNKKKYVIQTAKKLNLDGDTLLKRTDEDVQIILNSANYRKSDLDNLNKAIRDYRLISNDQMTDDDRGRAISKTPKMQQAAKDGIKNIISGKQHHYYFLPQAAYLESGEKSKGLIVDLLEICSMPKSDAQRLTEPFKPIISFETLPVIPAPDDFAKCIKNRNRFDFEHLQNRIAEYARLTELYWLNCNDDFVDIEGTICSPWCEHLMQRYSNAFIRIGIDNPTDGDVDAIINRIIQ